MPFFLAFPALGYNAFYKRPTHIDRVCILHSEVGLQTEHMLSPFVSLNVLRPCKVVHTGMLPCSASWDMTHMRAGPAESKGHPRPRG